MAGRSFRPTSVKNQFKRITATSSRHSPETQLWLYKQRNSHRWHNVRSTVRKIYPLCGGCDRLTTSIHHVRSAGTHPHLFYDISNLIGLCNSCHSRVSALENAGRFAEAIKLYDATATATAKIYYDNLK
ncbi:MAG: HNH endonuclease [Candidatus Kariarchaeaceae archaeon]|jgi:5-methylcytosine-specific restriction endonuclease McrA